PHPAAFCTLQGKTLKIFSAAFEEILVDDTPGSVLTDHKTYLKFACRDGLISVKDLQLEGKKRMKVDEFLRGIRL
ncbi:MAG: methionyl-tRNA formyltransferase, partial [Bacteroidetes bacterium]|nr:methionyl-tRNA formyltransferase [Bacteroidota bacterium]